VSAGLGSGRKRHGGQYNLWRPSPRLVDHTDRTTLLTQARLPDNRLALGAIFYSNRSMPADDSRASVKATDSNTQDGAVAFATTHWSVVLAAQGPAPAAQEALEKLCRTYWRPVYGFIRRQGARPQDAEDLTQGFFSLLLERRDFDAVRKEKGRLRSYLLTSLKHFLASEQRRALTVKRGKGQRLIPLEELRANERVEMEPADPLSADRLYERRWALTLMEQVLRRLKEEYCAGGNAALYDSLKQLLPDEPGAQSRAEIASQLGMTENALRQAFHRFRHRYQLLLREEISHTVAIASDVEDELRHLIAVLRT
jgi:RNA polymerase sigma factor (sigma-70 family)